MSFLLCYQEASQGPQGPQGGITMATLGSPASASLRLGKACSVDLTQVRFCAVSAGALAGRMRRAWDDVGAPEEEGAEEGEWGGLWAPSLDSGERRVFLGGCRPGSSGSLGPMRT